MTTATDLKNRTRRKERGEETLSESEALNNAEITLTQNTPIEFLTTSSTLDKQGQAKTSHPHMFSNGLYAFAQEELEVEDIISHAGGTAVILKVEYKGDTPEIPQHLALKRLKDPVVEGTSLSRKLAEIVFQEANTMREQGKVIPAVPKVYGIYEEKQGKLVHQGIVMELLEGKTFLEMIGNTELEKSLGYTQQVLDALEKLHASGEKRKAHRDIKPENLLVQTDERVRMLDWGSLTDKVDATLGATMGRKTGFQGTLKYSAPEQIEGYPKQESDIYSLGLVLYELLMGELIQEQKVGRTHEKIDFSRLKERVMHLSGKEDVAVKAAELVRKMTSAEYALRGTAREAKERIEEMEKILKEKEEVVYLEDVTEKILEIESPGATEIIINRILPPSYQKITLQKIPPPSSLTININKLPAVESLDDEIAPERKQEQELQARLDREQEEFEWKIQTGIEGNLQWYAKSRIDKSEENGSGRFYFDRFDFKGVLGEQGYKEKSLEGMKSVETYWTRQTSEGGVQALFEPSLKTMKIHHSYTYLEAATEEEAVEAFQKIASLEKKAGYLSWGMSISGLVALAGGMSFFQPQWSSGLVAAFAVGITGYIYSGLKGNIISLNLRNLDRQYNLHYGKDNNGDYKAITAALVKK